MMQSFHLELMKDAMVLGNIQTLHSVLTLCYSFKFICIKYFALNPNDKVNKMDIWIFIFIVVI